MYKDFSLILKSLRKDNAYTQKDLAKLLNLAQTTIANYENGTRAPDIGKISQIAELFNVSIDYLIGRNMDKTEEPGDYFENNKNDLDLSYKSYMSYLMVGDRKRALELCTSLLQREMNIEEFYKNIIEKSLIEVGVLWEKGVVDIWQEHLISEISIDIMRTLRLKFNLSKNNNKKIMALTPGPEIHNIGLRMVCNVLETKGWNSIYLGSNIPTLSVIDAIHKTKPDVLALSITTSSHIESARHLIGAIRNVYSKDCLSIIIGGSALSRLENIKELIGADYYFSNLYELVSNLDNL